MKTCETCRHYYRLPTDPNNVANRVGHCRAVPPSFRLIPQPNGAALPGSGYPILPVDFPACGMHAARVELACMCGGDS